MARQVDSCKGQKILFFVAVLCFTLNGFASPVPELLSTRILPAEIILSGTDSYRRFVVLGNFTDGIERDITSKSLIQVEHPSLALVDEAGKIKGLLDGKTRLIARFRGHTAKANLQVDVSRHLAPFVFLRDIGGVLTKNGCNASSCHGSVVGRGGFKLSINTLNPGSDYDQIRKGGVYSVFSAMPGKSSSPRVDTKHPNQSLLLLKPTGKLPHGGGLVFRENSLDYLTILNWIRNGATYREEKGNELIGRLEVVPGEVVMDLVGERQILVIGPWMNGQRLDMTDQVRYVVTDESVAQITETGLLKAKKSGQTGVIIHAAGYPPQSLQVIVIADPIVDYPLVDRNNFIDDYIFDRLRQTSIIPSELSKDTEFLRRLCLDLTGTLIPPERAREFMVNQDPRKRAELIEILINSPEFVEYWTFRFAELFRIALSAQNFVAKTSQSYWEWVRHSVSTNKSYDQMVRERISAQGYEGPVMHFQPIDEFREPENVMAEQARVFLGRRLDCAQCHDHPYEAWTQDQFWGMAAFFGRVTRLGDNEDFVVIDYPGGHGPMGRGTEMVHPRTGEAVLPRFLDGTFLPKARQNDPRMSLAEWITADQNPYFAKAAVNRIWSYFFGKGLVNPVDDFRSSTVSTHPALLQALADDFKAHNYDLKHLMRLIVQSRTYQLSQQPNDMNRSDQSNYSRFLPRPLDAEVLWDAINQFVEVEEEFEKRRGGRYSARTRVINLMIPDLVPAHFLEVFGQPTRLAVPERAGKPNRRQALHMLVGSTYTSKLVKRGGRIDRLLAQGLSRQQIVEELYLAALSRYPTEQEQEEIEVWIDQQPPGRQVWEDLSWSLISSREFAYNH